MGRFIVEHLFRESLASQIAAGSRGSLSVKVSAVFDESLIEAFAIKSRILGGRHSCLPALETSTIPADRNGCPPGSIKLICRDEITDVKRSTDPRAK